MPQRSQTERMRGVIGQIESREFGPRLWPSMARWDAAEMDAALAAVRAPLLAIQSTTRDAQLRRSALKAGQSSPYLDLIRSKVSGARIEVLAGVGHFAQIEAADEVTRLIGDFVRNRGRSPIS
jgi:pimeloyl-ACP methyl ester carboxylesterase